MHYLVTGGTGFVGAYVVRDLARQGHEVVVFDLAVNREYLQDVLCAEELRRVQLVSGDVTDLPALLRTMQDTAPKRLVHLAATLVLQRGFTPAGCTAPAGAYDARGMLHDFSAGDIPECPAPTSCQTRVWARRQPTPSRPGAT